MDEKAIEKFWSLVDKTNYCWNWIGRITKDYSPTFYSGNKEYFSRRFSLLLDGKDPPKFKKIRPLICNNSLCINPEHLVVGDDARFWNHVQKLTEVNGGCWVWISALDKHGYGAFTLRAPINKVVKAHRYSWQCFTGRPIPISLFVCHKCDHPYCVNPYHLFLGTNQDNIDDKVIKGRAGQKLTLDKVKEIKFLIETKEISQLNIANMYDVHISTINRISSGQTWHHSI